MEKTSASEGARVDRGHLCGCERKSGRQGDHAALGHHCGSEDHRRAILDQEQGRGRSSYGGTA